MSVLKNERKPSKMEVQTKAYDLAAYTIKAAGNEKVVAKHNRWAIGKQLADVALLIVRNIDLANSMNLDFPVEAEKRRVFQDTALALTFNLISLIHVARSLSNFDMDKHKHWIGLVLEEQRLLRGWIDSDRKRLKSP